jgi:hypothetical protein
LQLRRIPEVDNRDAISNYENFSLTTLILLCVYLTHLRLWTKYLATISLLFSISSKVIAKYFRDGDLKQKYKTECTWDEEENKKEKIGSVSH